MIALFKYITIYGATLLFDLDDEILMIMMRMVIGESRRKNQVLFQKGSLFSDLALYMFVSL